MTRLSFFRYLAAFDQVDLACPLRWLCPIVISFAPLKSQNGVFAEDPGV